MKEIIIGVLTGIFSSFVVTIIWHFVSKKISEKANEKINNAQYLNAFSQDIQIYCRYLDRLQMELDFPENEDKWQNILRAIEDRPFTHTFKNGLNAEGQSYMQKAHEIKSLIEASIHKKELDEIKCKKYKSEIFKLECEMLKNQTSIRQSWEYYKSHNN